MSKKETGGPAFPVLHQNEITGYIPPETSGMTLRDYFAGQALPNALKAAFSINGACEQAYEIADQMIKERNK